MRRADDVFAKWPELKHHDTGDRIAVIGIDGKCHCCNEVRMCLAVTPCVVEEEDETLTICLRCIRNLEHDTSQRVADGPQDDGEIF